MESINYVEVPADKTQDSNQGKTAWVGGKYASIDEGSAVTLFIGHHEETAWDEDGTERARVMAFPVRVKKPVTRAKAINAAEMEAYGLLDAEDLASFAASMARKYRENVNDLDVKGHDKFISWVKDGLDKIGIGKSSDPRIDEGEPTLGDVFGLLKAKVQVLGLDASEALAFRRFYPEWAVGIEVASGERYRLGNELWECIQSHTTQALWKPSLSTSSLWKRVDTSHAGTEDDPIPYVPPMELFKDKYYSQNGVTYRCTMDSGQALSHDLSALVGLYVEGVS